MSLNRVLMFDNLTRKFSPAASVYVAHSPTHTGMDILYTELLNYLQTGWYSFIVTARVKGYPVTMAENMAFANLS